MLYIFDSLNLNGTLPTGHRDLFTVSADYVLQLHIVVGKNAGAGAQFFTTRIGAPVTARIDAWSVKSNDSIALTLSNVTLYVGAQWISWKVVGLWLSVIPPRALDGAEAALPQAEGQGTETPDGEPGAPESQT